MVDKNDKGSDSIQTQKEIGNQQGVREAITSLLRRYQPPIKEHFTEALSDFTVNMQIIPALISEAEDPKVNRFDEREWKGKAEELKAIFNGADTPDSPLKLGDRVVDSRKKVEEAGVEILSSFAKHEIDVYEYMTNFKNQKGSFHESYERLLQSASEMTSLHADILKKVIPQDEGLESEFGEMERRVDGYRNQYSEIGGSERKAMMETLLKLEQELLDIAGSRGRIGQAEIKRKLLLHETLNLALLSHGIAAQIVGGTNLTMLSDDTLWEKSEERVMEASGIHAGILRIIKFNRKSLLLGR